MKNVPVCSMILLKKLQNIHKPRKPWTYHLHTHKPNEFPLKQKIFEKASAALRNKSNMETSFKSHSSGLLTKTKFITTNRIFKSASDKDILAS